jgi:hypothetical protein
MLFVAADGLGPRDPFAGPARASVMDRAGLCARNVHSWRRPGATVQWWVADRVLTSSGYLWFDVWPACGAHEDPDPSCGACDAHARARLAFTGERTCWRRRAVA